MASRVVDNWNASAAFLGAYASSHCSRSYSVVCFDSCIELLGCLLELLLHLHLLIVRLLCAHTAFHPSGILLVFVACVTKWPRLAWNSCLVFNFDVDRVGVRFCASLSWGILSGTRSMRWDVSYCPDTSIHGIVHHLTTLVKSRSTHVERILASLTTGSSITSVISIWWASSWSSIVRNDASSNYTESTRILALSSLLKRRWLVLVGSLPLNWACAKLWQVMNHLGTSFLDLRRLISRSVVR